MLNLPIYFLGCSYYLHTRIGGKQVKRSLRTSYQRLASIRAITLLDSLMRKDLPQKYELDASRGIFKAEGPEDHARLMQAIEALKMMQSVLPLGHANRCTSARRRSCPSPRRHNSLENGRAARKVPVIAERGAFNRQVIPCRG